MLRVSNKLKKSRLHGVNRTLSWYRIKNKRDKWFKVRRKRIIFKARSNKKRMSPLSYINIRYVRLRGIARISLHNRLYWKSLYPGINVSNIRLDKHSELRDKCKKGESVLWKLESRLDVLLWRSGIVATIPMAKQLVRSGNVEIYKDSIWSVAKRADQRLSSNIVMKLTSWNTLRDTAKMKWTSPLYKHKVPGYRLVNYSEGMLTMRHKPKDGEVRVPTCLPIRVVALK